jgi:ABC-2 type transport system ATP-binding protein
MGILYTSHNMPEIEAVCDRIVFIHEGKTITEGTPGEVLKNFQTRTLEELFIKIVRARG